MDLLKIWDLIISGVLRGGIYVMMSMGLSLVFGVMNIPNFAHGEFYMIGAYVAYFGYVLMGLNPILCMLMACFSGFVAGALLEKTCFYPLRLSSKGNWVMNSFMVTAGIAFILQNLAQAIIGVNVMGIDHFWGGSVDFISGMAISTDRMAAFLVGMGSAVLFWLFLKYSRTGNAIRAVSEDEEGAVLIGINLNNIHTLTFALSAMLAALAGAILLSITPAYPMMGLQPLYKSWFVVILVGMGNVGATFIGGILVGLIEAISYYALGAGWQDVISLCVIILVLLVRPSGLFGSDVKGVWER